jgi:gamma-glutamyltranspeptidase/glutathione hydrolase
LILAGFGSKLPIMRDFHLPGRSQVYASNGMCATSHPLAAKTAVQLLEAGGNAVDAAIGAAILLGICEPQMTGIGGDCFVLFQPSNSDEILALNGSGRAPVNADPGRLRDAGHASVGNTTVDAVTVPGAIDAFCELSTKHGRQGLKFSLAPAIHYAQAGVPVSQRTSVDWLRAIDRLQGPAREFYLLDGNAPKAGQVFRAPRQAEVLRRICEDGRSGFYEGEVAEDMIASLALMGGTHQLQDFADTKCTWGSPISGEYGGMELVEHPPNGQGATAILMANMLKHFDIGSLDPLGVQRVHIEAEAAKLAYDARNRIIADPDHTSRVEAMLSTDLADTLAKMIRHDRVLTNPAKVLEDVHKETVYLTVVDSDRNIVSLIYSVYHSFGSGLASTKFGINFQSRGAGFTLEKGHPNELGGGKRPMHTIIPGMLRKNGKTVMPFGVMGGGYQPSGHVRFLSNLVDFDMDLQTAIDAPRSFFDAGVLNVERGYNDNVRQELVELGHNVAVPEVPIGGAQAIYIDPDSGVLCGASDPRKDGCALGY